MHSAVWYGGDIAHDENVRLAATWASGTPSRLTVGSYEDSSICYLVESYYGYVPSFADFYAVDGVIVCDTSCMTVWPSFEDYVVRGGIVSMAEPYAGVISTTYSRVSSLYDYGGTAALSSFIEITGYNTNETYLPAFGSSIHVVAVAVSGSPTSPGVDLCVPNPAPSIYSSGTRTCTTSSAATGIVAGYTHWLVENTSQNVWDARAALRQTATHYPDWNNQGGFGEVRPQQAKLLNPNDIDLQPPIWWQPIVVSGDVQIRFMDFMQTRFDTTVIGYFTSPPSGTEVPADADGILYNGSGQILYTWEDPPSGTYWLAFWTADGSGNYSPLTMGNYSAWYQVTVP